MATAETKVISPLCVRVSAHECARLQKAAGDRSVSDYVRDRLFDDGARSSPSLSKQDLARILALLGQSDFAPSLREIAKAAKTGVMPLSEETEALEHEACEAILQFL